MAHSSLIGQFSNSVHVLIHSAMPPLGTLSSDRARLPGAFLLLKSGRPSESATKEEQLALWFVLIERKWSARCDG